MSDSAHEQEIHAWRSARLARLTARDGWLSLIGKVFLESGVPVAAGAAADGGVSLSADKAPARLGTFELAGGRVRFTPEPGAVLEIERAGAELATPVRGALELTSDARGRPDRLRCGDLALDVMERGNTFAVRVRDLARARAEFAGIEYYPIRPEWRVRARLETYTPERAIELVYESGIAEPYYAPGALVFAHADVEYRLDPVYEQDRKRLWIVFGDPTNRDQTYGAGRFLYAALPEAGQVWLDFNQAFNPPCAFSPFVACPLPPFQNRLAARVEAGEKRPRAHD